MRIEDTNQGKAFLLPFKNCCNHSMQSSQRTSISYLSRVILTDYYKTLCHAWSVWIIFFCCWVLFRFAVVLLVLLLPFGLILCYKVCFTTSRSHVVVGSRALSVLLLFATQVSFLVRSARPCLFSRSIVISSRMWLTARLLLPRILHTFFLYAMDQQHKCVRST